MKASDAVPASAPIRLALFDFDGTLSRVNSYHVYLKWILAQRDLYSARLFVALMLRRLRLVPSRRVKNLALGRLGSWSQGEVAALGQRLYRLEIKPQLRAEALAELAKRQQQGYRVLIVSGGFDFLLQPFAEEYHLSHLHCARLAFNEQICLGCLDGGEMRGAAKLEFLQRHLAAEQVDWTRSCAYSDEASDLPLLQAVGEPFLVGQATSAPRLPANIQRVTWE